VKITKHERIIGDDDDEDQSSGDEDMCDGQSKLKFANFEEIRSKRLKNADTCMLCKLGFKPGSGSKKHLVVKNMQQVHEEHGSSMPPEELAGLIILVYNKDYRDIEVEKKNFNVPILSKSTAVEHLRFHMFTHTQTLDDTIQDLLIIENELKNGLLAPYVGSDGKCVMVPVQKNVDAYIKVVKQKTATVVAANQIKQKRGAIG
jgi:hypothetical protein